MWDLLGFKESPYNCAPLGVNKEDVDLLVGRAEESVNLCTILESAKQGITVISGRPGVGKTSFLNIQQFLLENGESVCGPKIIACRHISAVNPRDTIRDLALRVVFDLHKSIESFCTINKIRVPKEVSKVGKWIANRGNESFDIGLDIAGFGGSLGRQVDLPNIADISYEGIVDVISGLVSEVVNSLKRPGIIIVLDNIENLEEKQLSDMLISFRDTLFSIPCVWWTLIGQSGLGSYIQTLDERVFQRIAGTAIELSPISEEEFHAAIKQRVLRFHANSQGEAPLPKEVHDFLYNAAKGQIRFVFKYSNDICTGWVSNIRNRIISNLAKNGHKIDRTILDESIGQYLVEEQIDRDSAFITLKEKVEGEFKILNLKPDEISVLKTIGDKVMVRPKQHREFGIPSIQKFCNQYLTKLYQQNLLSRKQEGKAVLYSLNGLSMLAYSYSLLD